MRYIDYMLSDYYPSSKYINKLTGKNFTNPLVDINFTMEDLSFHRMSAIDIKDIPKYCFLNFNLDDDASSEFKKLNRIPHPNLVYPGSIVIYLKHMSPTITTY